MTTTPYEVLGLTPDASRAELEAAYQAKQAAYDPARLAGLDPEFAALAATRQAELNAAYRSLRPALAAPPRLEPQAERQRDRQTVIVLVVLAMLAALIPLLRDVAPPVRTAVPAGAETALRTSEVAPAFTLPTIDGQEVSLSDYRGQVVLVNIWATWCPPCVREIPRLVRVHEQFKDQGFAVIGINTTYQDQLDKVTTFVRDQGISYPVLLDHDGAVGAQYSSRLMPTSYLIDRDGKIVVTKVGEVDEAQLREQVAALLRGEVP
jgi:cytochrome c biogenesis protein CcmG, thiol:disulfide interchange protein DsbE